MLTAVGGLVDRTMLPYQSYSYKCREQAKWRELVSILAHNHESSQVLEQSMNLVCLIT